MKALEILFGNFPLLRKPDRGKFCWKFYLCHSMNLSLSDNFHNMNLCREKTSRMFWYLLTSPKRNVFKTNVIASSQIYRKSKKIQGIRLPSLVDFPLFYVKLVRNHLRNNWLEINSRFHLLVTILRYIVYKDLNLYIFRIEVRFENFWTWKWWMFPDN